MTSPGTPPRGGAQWVRSVEQRLAALARPAALRIGPWVLSHRDGSLVATRPGETVELSTGEPVTIDIGALRGVATKGDVAEVTAHIESTDGYLETIVDDLLGALGVEPLGALLDRIFDLGDAIGDLLGLADSADSNVVSGFANFFNSWFGGSGADGTPDEVADAVADIRAEIDSLKSRVSDLESGP